MRILARVKAPAIETSRMGPASPSKAVGELNDLDIGDTNEVWLLIDLF
jgi:hypothetical protein